MACPAFTKKRVKPGRLVWGGGKDLLVMEEVSAGFQLLYGKNTHSMEFTRRVLVCSGSL